MTESNHPSIWSRGEVRHMKVEHGKPWQPRWTYFPLGSVVLNRSTRPSWRSLTCSSATRLWSTKASSKVALQRVFPKSAKNANDCMLNQRIETAKPLLPKLPSPSFTSQISSMGETMPHPYPKSLVPTPCWENRQGQKPHHPMVGGVLMVRIVMASHLGPALTFLKLSGGHYNGKCNLRLLPAIYFLQHSCTHFDMPPKPHPIDTISKSQRTQCGKQVFHGSSPATLPEPNQRIHRLDILTSRRIPGT